MRDALEKLADLRLEVGPGSLRYVGALLGTEICLGYALTYDDLDRIARMQRLPVGEPVDPPPSAVEPSGIVGDGTVWLAANVLAGRLCDWRAGRQRRFESDPERQAVSRALRAAVGPASQPRRQLLAKPPAGPTKLEQSEAARRRAEAARKRRERQRRRGDPVEPPAAHQRGRWDEEQCRDYVADVASWYEPLGIGFCEALAAGLGPPVVYDGLAEAQDA